MVLTLKFLSWFFFFFFLLWAKNEIKRRTRNIFCSLALERPSHKQRELIEPLHSSCSSFESSSVLVYFIDIFISLRDSRIIFERRVLVEDLSSRIDYIPSIRVIENMCARVRNWAKLLKSEDSSLRDLGVDGFVEIQFTADEVGTENSTVSPRFAWPSPKSFHPAVSLYSMERTVGQARSVGQSAGWYSTGIQRDDRQRPTGRTTGMEKRRENQPTHLQNRRWK